MRIELKHRHRFRDVAERRPVIVQTDELPEPERRLVERLVKESGLLANRAQDVDRPILEAASYTFVIEETPGRRHAATVGQSQLSPALGKLIAMLVKARN
jgi:hypothetical protein